MTPEQSLQFADWLYSFLWEIKPEFNRCTSLEWSNAIMEQHKKFSNGAEPDLPQLVLSWTLDGNYK